MQAKIILFAGALALAGSALTGCVETAPGYGGYYHSSTVYVHEDHHRDRDRDHRDRDYRHTRDRDHDRHGDRDMHHRDDHHMSDHRSYSRVDCRRDPRNRACRHH